MSHKGMHYLFSHLCAHLDIGGFNSIWRLNPFGTANFREGKLLLAELGRKFPNVENKGYDSKTLI